MFIINIFQYSTVRLGIYGCFPCFTWVGLDGVCSKRDHKLGDQKEVELNEIAEVQLGGIRSLDSTHFTFLRNFQRSNALERIGSVDFSTGKCWLPWSGYNWAKIEPRNLTVDRLRMSYIFSIVPMALSVVVFLCEVSIFYSKIFRRKAIETLCAYFIVWAFFGKRMVSPSI